MTHPYDLTSHKTYNFINYDVNPIEKYDFLRKHIVTTKKIIIKIRATRDLNPRLFAPKANTLPPELATLINLFCFDCYIYNIMIKSLYVLI